MTRDGIALATSAGALISMVDLASGSMPLAQELKFMLISYAGTRNNATLDTHPNDGIRPVVTC